MQKLLFVCLGNICRSPLAAETMRLEAAAAGLDALEVDSAATGSWHLDEGPDPRALEAGLGRGIDISGHRSRLIEKKDFILSDMILALDEDVHATLTKMADAQTVTKIRLLLDFAETTTEREIPTPYFGDDSDFELALDLIEDGVRGLTSYLKSLRA